MYAYLTWATIFGLIWLILFVNRKDLRFEMLFSSLLFLPFGLTQPLFVPEYWNPVVIFKIFGLFDLESLLWCFFTGGIVAVLYEEVFNKRLKVIKSGKKSRRHAYIIYASMILAALAILWIKYFTEWSVLRSLLIIATLIFIYFISTRRDLLKESLAAGLLFTIFYIVSLLFIDLVFPGFIKNQWTIQGTWEIKIFSIYIEEYIYAFLFGISWSIVFEEIKNIKVINK